MLEARKLGWAFVLSLVLLISGLMTLFCPVGQAGSLSLVSYVWTSPKKDLPLLKERVVRQIQKNPYDAEAFYLLAVLSLRDFSNRPEDSIHLTQAVNFSQQAIDLDSESEWGYCALAEALLAAGQNQKAELLLTSALEARLASGWLGSLTRARIAAKSQQPDLALGLFEKSLNQVGADRELIAFSLSEYLLAAKRNSDLISQLLDLNRLWPSYAFQSAIGRQLSEQGQFRQAEKIFEALPKGSISDEDQLRLAILRYKNLPKAVLAVTSLEKLVQKSQVDSESEWTQVLKEHLALAYLAAGNFSKASKVSLDLYRESSDRVATLDFIEENYQKIQRQKELFVLLKEMTLLDQAPAEVFLSLGHLQLNFHKQASFALESYTKAVLLEPDRAEFRVAVGLAYYQLKELNKAKEAFRLAVAIDPFDGSSRYNLACAFSLTGSREEALKQLEMALSLGQISPVELKVTMILEVYATILNSKK